MSDTFEVWRFRQGWAVLNTSTKERESGLYVMQRDAEACADRMNRDQAARRHARTRACMTCGKPFQSEGNHNRMCDPCRRRGRDYDPMMVADQRIEGSW